MSLVAAKVCVSDAYGTLFDLACIPGAVRADLGDRADSLMRLWRRRQLEISWLPLRPGARDLAGGLNAVLSAESVQRFKPDPLVYQLAATHFGVEPPSVYCVSGNGWDVSAAAAVGFQVVWIDRDETSPEKAPLGVRKTIADLTELPAILGV